MSNQETRIAVRVSLNNTSIALVVLPPTPPRVGLQFFRQALYSKKEILQTRIQKPNIVQDSTIRICFRLLHVATAMAQLVVAARAEMALVLPSLVLASYANVEKTLHAVSSLDNTAFVQLITADGKTLSNGAVINEIITLSENCGSTQVRRHD